MTEATVGTLASADHAAIRDVSKRLPDLLVGRNFFALAQLHTEDAVFMPPHHPAIHGRAALESWMASFPRVLRMTLTVEDVGGRRAVSAVDGVRYPYKLWPLKRPNPAFPHEPNWTPILNVRVDRWWFVFDAEVGLFGEAGPSLATRARLVLSWRRT